MFNCCIILYVCGSTSTPIEYISYTPLLLDPVCLFCHITVTELFIVLAEIAQTHTPTNTKPLINRQKSVHVLSPLLVGTKHSSLERERARQKSIYLNPHLQPWRK